MTQVMNNRTIFNGGCSVEVKTSNQNFVDGNFGTTPDPLPICCISGTGNTGNNVTPDCH